MANAYGILVKMDEDIPQQKPSLTFSGFTGQIIGFESPVSPLKGIVTVATDLNFEGSLTADDIHLNFSQIRVAKNLSGLEVDPSDYEIKNSDFSFNQIQASEGSSLTVKGVEISSYRFNNGSVESVSVNVENSTVNQVLGISSIDYNRVVPDSQLKIKNSNVSITNSDVDDVTGYQTVDVINATISGNEMSVAGGKYGTVVGFNVQDFYGEVKEIQITDNRLAISNVKSPSAAFAGVFVESFANQTFESSIVTRNTVSLKDSDIGTLVVALGQHNDINHLFNSGNTVEFEGVNRINGELAGFDRMEYTVNAENKDKAVLTLNYTPIETASVKNVPTHTFDGTTIAVAKGAGIENGINYKLISVLGVDAQFTNTTVEAESTFVNSEWNVDDFTLKNGETLEVRWGQEQGNPDVDPDPENPEVDPTPDPDPGTDPEPGTDPDTPVLDPDNPDHQTATENSKTLSESLLGTVAFVNQGAEFIADEGIVAMVNAAKLGQLATFGAVHGGSSNYQTGSRVDVDGYTLAAGASYQVNPQWIVGGFIEAGWADSDSHVNGTKGEGDHDYYGLGLASRYLVNDAWYIDGSLRAGQASTEFTGVYAGDNAKYDSDAFYVTAHIGTGYVFNLTNTMNLDLYGRYLITYLDGDDVNLNNKYGDRLNMDSTVTHAVRIGTRLTGAFCPYAGWKLGLAYEHIFDGDAESAVNSLNLEVPSLEGDTGIMEVGVTMKPSVNSHWSMDVGAKGYAGDREGVTGSVLIRYAF